MDRSFRAAAGILLLSAASLPSVAQSQPVPSIRRVQVLRSAGQMEIEIEASDPVVPRVNVLTNPDRLIVDYINAVPGAQLRNQTVNRGEVKGLRVGLFSARPPVTRVVVDLKGPQAYQVFPSGRNVIVKVGGGENEAANARPASRLSLINTNFPTQSVQITPPVAKPKLVVSFDNGELSVSANKASLSEVLFAIHQRTGAEIAIPAGAEQEQVMADYGPAPAPEVLASLLNGSKFNFLILSSSTDPRALDRVILSSRPEGPAPPPPPPSRVVAEEEEETNEPARKGDPGPGSQVVDKPAPPTDDSTPGQDHPKVPSDTDAQN